MASFTVEVPDSALTRVQDAVSASGFKDIESFLLDVLRRMCIQNERLQRENQAQVLSATVEADVTADFPLVKPIAKEIT